VLRSRAPHIASGPRNILLYKQSRRDTSGARVSRSHNQETHAWRFITPVVARKYGSANTKVKSAFQPHYSREPAAWEDERYNQKADVLKLTCFWPRFTRGASRLHDTTYNSIDRLTNGSVAASAAINRGASTAVRM
jgi:hypothetical protein